MLRLAKELDPSLRLWVNVAVLLMLIDPETGKPTPAVDGRAWQACATLSGRELPVS
jgi:hypothetical protein